MTSLAIMVRLRGPEMAMVLQEPMISQHLVYTVGEELADQLTRARGLTILSEILAPIADLRREMGMRVSFITTGAGWPRSPTAAS